MKHTTRVLVSSHDNKHIGANPQVVMRLCPGVNVPKVPCSACEASSRRLFQLKIEESDLTSEVENVDLVILHRSVRSVPRNSDFARHRNTPGREGRTKAEEQE